MCTLKQHSNTYNSSYEFAFTPYTWFLKFLILMFINIFSYINICIKFKFIFNRLRFYPNLLWWIMNSWYRTGGINSSKQLHYKHISLSPSNVSIAAFEGDLDSSVQLRVVSKCCHLLHANIVLIFVLCFFPSLAFLLVNSSCIWQIKTVLIARISGKFVLIGGWRESRVL